MSDSGQEIKVYMVFDISQRFWYPIPFARRISAENWAVRSGYKLEQIKVEGFRVRG